jgi:hypothetical protein
MFDILTDQQCPFPLPQVQDHAGLRRRHQKPGNRRFHADSSGDAENRVHDRIFLDDLMVLATGGLALWDGVSKIDVREALAAEATKWRASRAKAIRQGNIDSTDDTWIAFLVPLSEAGRSRRR